MRLQSLWFCVLLAAVAGCSPHETASTSDRRANELAMAWPKDWTERLGKKVTLEGTAANAKLGAFLLGDVDEIWIHDLDEWPAECFGEGGKGKRVRVTGTIVKRDDLPVFVQKPGVPPRAGMPVQSEEELEKAKWRFLLKDVTWKVVD